MKPAKQKEKSSSSRFPEFQNFLLGIFKRRVFLVFLLPGMLAFLVPLIIPELSLLMVFGVCIVFIGFIWAAFMHYHDLLHGSQRAVVTVPRERNDRSGVAISFVPGNEYHYSLSDPYSGQDLHITQIQRNSGIKCHFDERGRFFINGEVYYMMAKGSLEINFQLFNSGDVALDILSVYVDDNLGLNHMRIYLDGVFLRGGKVHFPFHLKKGEFITLQSRHKISLGMGSTDSLFAADMRSLPETVLFDLIVNTSNEKGRRQSYVAELATPSKSLVDLYINQWREYDQKEYLVLAGHAQAGAE